MSTRSLAIPSHRPALPIPFLALILTTTLFLPACKTTPTNTSGNNFPSGPGDYIKQVERSTSAKKNTNPSVPNVNWSTPSRSPKDNNNPVKPVSTNLKPATPDPKTKNNLDTKADPKPGTKNTTEKKQPSETRSNATPQSPTLLTDHSTSDLVKALIAKISRDQRLKSKGLRPYLAQAALTLVDPKRELAAEDLKDLSADDRKLILAWQNTFTLLGRSLGKDTPKDRAQLKLAAEELAEQIKSEKKLTIQTIQLCRSVRGYGIYTPFLNNTFLANQANRMIVYCEIDNFKSVAQTNGEFAVSLTQEAVLLTEADGQPVWRLRPVTVIDRSKNLRRDFFLIADITLPASLNVGRYTLQITITDRNGNAFTSSNIKLNYVADAKLLNANP